MRPQRRLGFRLMLVLLGLIDSRQHGPKESPTSVSLWRVEPRTGAVENIARCLPRMHGSSPPVKHAHIAPV
jgi:hypothetical protein